MNWVDHNGTWFCALLLDEGSSLGAQCIGYRDSPQLRVCPVDVLMDPVNCKSIWGLDACTDHSGVVGAVVSFVHLGTGWESSDWLSCSCEPAVSTLKEELNFQDTQATLL